MADEPDVRGSFMTWAHISARLWRRPYIERMRILADEGVASGWSEADQHWLGVLMEDIEAGRVDRIESYLDLCRRAAERDPKDLVDPVPAHLGDAAQPIGWQPPAIEPHGETARMEAVVLTAPESSRTRRRAETLPLEAERTTALRAVIEDAGDDPSASNDGS